MGEFEYAGLPGVKAKRLGGVMVNSPTGAMKSIRECRVCSAAGDHGAVTLWRDDEGNLRTCFQVRWSTVAAETHATRDSALRWLKAWWPAMYDQHHRDGAHHV